MPSYRLWSSLAGLFRLAPRALVLLVISCPRPGHIYPFGYFAGIGGASKRGVLVKGANYLEALAQVDTVVLTRQGPSPRVRSVWWKSRKRTFRKMRSCVLRFTPGPFRPSGVRFVREAYRDGVMTMTHRRDEKIKGMRMQAIIEVTGVGRQ